MARLLVSGVKLFVLSLVVYGGSVLGLGFWGFGCRLTANQTLRSTSWLKILPKNPSFLSVFFCLLSMLQKSQKRGVSLEKTTSSYKIMINFSNLSRNSNFKPQFF